MYRSLLRVAIVAGVVGAAEIVVAQQTTTSREVRKIEVMAIDANRLVAREASGSREYNVARDAHLVVNGRTLPIRDLKPGMSGNATIETTTTVTPVRVTEVRHSDVVRVDGNMLIVKGPDGVRMLSPGDFERRDITIMKDGRPVDFTGLHAGDHLTTTIVTDGPPKVATRREIATFVATTPAVAAAPKKTTTRPATARRKAAAPPGKVVSWKKPARRLPTTASTLPLTALAGLTMLGAGSVLMCGRRLRAVLTAADPLPPGDCP